MVQVFKIVFINLNSIKNNGIDFLNKLMGKIEILLIDFQKKTTFWEILK